jgi:META domain
MIGRRWRLRLVLCAAVVVQAGASLAADAEFPSDGNLILDANPMPGSKRVPVMDIGDGGRIVLDLWCSRVEGQLVVAGDTITVMTGPSAERACTPERTRGDAELIGALNAVTNWRRQGDIVTLIGPKSLRFRVPTN